ncbi:hypothetical protein [Pedobacter jamesrossensis]|uniref:Uncharacterized protein n=1 Tax=Pedobacter jamesrossensis TaxID=1908238 RepID=A0ABV8NM48_9SPHI
MEIVDGELFLVAVFIDVIMELKKRTQMLNTFMSKALQLRGFGDMDAYRLVSDFGKINPQIDGDQVMMIISDLSSPHTYNQGKQRFIRGIRELQDSIHQEGF